MANKARGQGKGRKVGMPRLYFANQGDRASVAPFLRDRSLLPKRSVAQMLRDRGVEDLDDEAELARSRGTVVLP